MAPTAKRRRAAKPTPAQRTILEQLRDALHQQTTAPDGTARKMTKIEALVEILIEQALNGDQKALAGVMKLVEKLETLEAGAEPEQPRTSRQEWEAVFAFYGKYGAMIEREIERLKEENPSYWSFDWFHPADDAAPWRRDLHGVSDEMPA